MKTGLTGYVSPNDAGLNSEPRAVGRRLAKLLDALSDNVNSWIANGEIVQEVLDFRRSLVEKLEADGWEVKLNARNHYTVKPTKQWWESLRGQK